MRAANRRKRLGRPATADQIDDQNDDGNDQQHVNQTACDVETEAEKPQNQQDDEYCPKHACLFWLRVAAAQT